LILALLSDILLNPVERLIFDILLFFFLFFFYIFDEYNFLF